MLLNATAFDQPLPKSISVCVQPYAPFVMPFQWQGLPLDLINSPPTFTNPATMSGSATPLNVTFHVTSSTHKFIILIYLLFILHTSFPGISFTGLNVSKITGFDIAFSRLVLESYLGMKVSYLPYPDTSSMCAVCCLHKSIYII